MVTLSSVVMVTVIVITFFVVMVTLSPVVMVTIIVITFPVSW